MCFQQTVCSNPVGVVQWAQWAYFQVSVLIDGLMGVSSVVTLPLSVGLIRPVVLLQLGLVLGV